MDTKSKIQPLSMFEETLMFSSYRYMIGRHSIASSMFAGDLVKEFVPRMSEDKRKFVAEDVNSCVNQQLWSLNIHVDRCFNTKINALYLLFEELSAKGLLDKLQYIKSATIKRDSLFGENNEVKFEVSDEVSSQYVFDDVANYLQWMDFSNALNKSCHKKVTLQGEDLNNGEPCQFEVFPSYVERFRENGKRTFHKVWRDIDRYMANPHSGWYLAEDMIIKVEDL